jgi:hypothetical protein
MAALERTDLDNLDLATPADGILRLKVTNERKETDYLDALRVVAVDHDPGVVVAPDPSGNISAGTCEGHGAPWASAITGTVTSSTVPTARAITARCRIA